AGGRRRCPRWATWQVVGPRAMRWEALEQVGHLLARRAMSPRDHRAPVRDEPIERQQVIVEEAERLLLGVTSHAHENLDRLGVGVELAQLLLALQVERERALQHLVVSEQIVRQLV